jgi:hypothetical protein
LTLDYVLVKERDLTQKDNFALKVAKTTLEGFKALDKAAYEEIRGSIPDVLDAPVDLPKANKDEQKPFIRIIGGMLKIKVRIPLFAVRWTPAQTTQQLADQNVRSESVNPG